MNYTGERYLPGGVDANIAMEHWHRYRLIADFVRGKNVVDFACGEGYGSHLLSLYANKVTGIDISEEAICSAKSKYQSENLNFEIGSLSDEFSSTFSEVEVIVSFETFEHVNEETQLNFLEQARIALGEKGVLIISTPNKTYFNCYASHDNEFHLKEYEHHEFKGVLEKYFSYSGFLLQNFQPASTIVPENCYGKRIDLAEIYELNGQDISERPTLFLYSIAFCSQFELNDIPKASALIDSKEGWRDNFVTSSLYLDFGEGFSQKNVLTKASTLNSTDTLRLKFDIDKNVKGIRFDPCEMPCLIKIKEVNLSKSQEAHPVVFSNIVKENNSFDEPDEGCYRFLTPDPIFILDLCDYVQYIEIEFSLEKISLSDACLQLQQETYNLKSKIENIKNIVIKGSYEKSN